MSDPTAKGALITPWQRRLDNVFAPMTAPLGAIMGFVFAIVFIAVVIGNGIRMDIADALKKRSRR